MQFLEQTLKKQYQSWYVSILLNTWAQVSRDIKELARQDVLR